MPNKNYSLPALTAGIINQGLASYAPRDHSTILKNVISISANGANSGATFYQDEEFTVLQDAYAIRFREKELTKNESLYFVSAISKLTNGNFDWTNKAGWIRIKYLSITLPVTPVGDIDFAFMERYIRELEEFRVRELDTYLEVSGLANYRLTSAEKSALTKLRTGGVRLKNFRIGDLFFSQVGNRDIQQKDLEESGGIVVSSGLENSGIIGKTTLKAKIIPANTLTVDMFGNAFYRDYEYKMVTHARIFSLEWKDFSPTREMQLYVLAQLSYFNKIFSFSHMATFRKIKDYEIILPVTNSGEIDFAFMENFIRAQEKIAIKNVILWREKEIATTKQVIN